MGFSAYGVTDPRSPDRDLQIGLRWRSSRTMQKPFSYLTWQENETEGCGENPSERILVSEERASMPGAWGHPLLGGCIFRPTLRTELVARLRKQYPAEKVLPALYGCTAWWMRSRWNRYRLLSLYNCARCLS